MSVPVAAQNAAAVAVETVRGAVHALGHDPDFVDVVLDHVDLTRFAQPDGSVDVAALTRFVVKHTKPRSR